jgi:hypothetical protein
MTGAVVAGGLVWREALDCHRRDAVDGRPSAPTPPQHAVAAGEPLRLKHSGEHEQSARVWQREDADGGHPTEVDVASVHGRSGAGACSPHAMIGRRAVRGH